MLEQSGAPQGQRLKAKLRLCCDDEGAPVRLPLPASLGKQQLVSLPAGVGVGCCCIKLGAFLRARAAGGCRQGAPAVYSPALQLLAPTVMSLQQVDALG